MATKTTLSLQEFLKLPEAEADGTHYELDEGEIVTLSPTGMPHARCIERIFRYLIKHLPEDRYDILPGEAGFILGRDPRPIVRGADLAVMHHRDDYPEGLSTEPPLLAIEVLSPSNTPDDIERKRLQYLSAGAREVWIVYEKAKTIHVFRSREEPLSFVAERNGAFQSALGFPVVVKEIFR